MESLQSQEPHKPCHLSQIIEDGITSEVDEYPRRHQPKQASGPWNMRGCIPHGESPSPEPVSRLKRRTPVVRSTDLWGRHRRFYDRARPEMLSISRTDIAVRVIVPVTPLGMGYSRPFDSARGHDPVQMGRVRYERS